VFQPEVRVQRGMSVKRLRCRVREMCRISWRQNGYERLSCMCIVIEREI
jgi:hypothetical protein